PVSTLTSNTRTLGFSRFSCNQSAVTSGSAACAAPTMKKAPTNTPALLRKFITSHSLTCRCTDRQCCLYVSRVEEKASQYLPISRACLRLLTESQQIQSGTGPQPQETVLRLQNAAAEIEIQHRGVAMRRNARAMPFEVLRNVRDAATRI